MAKKRKTFDEQLREHIRKCGVTRYRIWKDTGVHQSVLSNFLSGRRTLSQDTINTLVEYLGLELKKKGR